jgi:hypothetical protein
MKKTFVTAVGEKVGEQGSKTSSDWMESVCRETGQGIGSVGSDGKAILFALLSATSWLPWAAAVVR